MNKYVSLSLVPLLLLSLGGCSRVGDRSSSISVVYFTAALLSFLFLVSCFLLLGKKEGWLLTIFFCVFIVNCGYFAISVSSTLNAALWANRIAYLGSSILPLAMLMAILKVSGIKSSRWLLVALFAVAISVFIIASTPGITDIYYKEVSLGSYNGATVLIKEYGPLHCVNLFYLLGYAVITAAIAINTVIKKKLQSGIQTFALVASVVVNIGLWLLEQFVRIDFELLSLSYIISELFLLYLFLTMKYGNAAEAPTKAVTEPLPDEEPMPVPTAEDELLEVFKSGVSRLTPTESTIYGFYLEGKSTKEIMATLNITENTLKYHNKNIYSKLGVCSRKQLIERSKML